MRKISAFAHINIALIKYWGKSDLKNNIPTTPSLSLTVNKFGTKTSLSESNSNSDYLTINNIKQSGLSLKRVIDFINIFRNLTGIKKHLTINSFNNMPIASGMASSASGFASLAVACNKYFNLNLNKQKLSKLARLGSGSAARSIFGNFVALNGGINIDNKECIAKNVKYSKLLHLNMLIVICSNNKKDILSRSGMNYSYKTSPFFSKFIEINCKLFKQALNALELGCFKKLGEAMEQSTLNMHATCLSSNPGFWYFNSTTIKILNKIKQLRKKNYKCYFTMDAGPHVKILCYQNDAFKLKKELEKINGIISINILKQGQAAYLL